jgi:hypothetical protein
MTRWRTLTGSTYNSRTLAAVKAVPGKLVRQRSMRRMIWINLFTDVLILLLNRILLSWLQLRYLERCFCDGLTIYLLTYLFIYLFAQSPSLVIFFLHLLSCYLDLCIVKLYVPDKCFILENLHIFYLLIIFLIQKYIYSTLLALRHPVNISTLIYFAK